MSQVRQRPITTKQQSTSDDDSSQEATLISPEQPQQPPPPPPSPRSSSQGAISKTLTSTANLANLLPTGTLLAFQILTPVFTNNGTCNDMNRLLTGVLLAVLAISCFLASLTDSVEVNGKVYHGLATFKGLWLFDFPVDGPAGSDLPDMSKKRLRLLDFIHAILSVSVFAAVAMRDRNVVSCLYPAPALETKQVLDIVPVGIGLICSLLFVVFPTTRHGVGYPVTLSN